MPCDWTHHLKQEWMLDQFVPEINVDDLIDDVEQLVAQSEVAVQHSERIRSSKAGTAKELAPMGESRRKGKGKTN